MIKYGFIKKMILVAIPFYLSIKDEKEKLLKIAPIALEKGEARNPL